jgi:hypothetical protein
MARIVTGSGDMDGDGWDARDAENPRYFIEADAPQRMESRPPLN